MIKLGVWIYACKELISLGAMEMATEGGLGLDRVQESESATRVLT